MVNATETSLEEVLAGMLTENTGSALLDSGGTPKFVDGKYAGSEHGYGRQWERNQGMTIESFEGLPEATLERYGFYSKSLYHWLKQVVSFDPELDETFQSWMDRPDNAEKHWLELMDEFGKDIAHGSGIYGDGKAFSENTYNHESSLDGVIQYVYFELKDDRTILGTEFPAGGYALIQIHGGADVRGGYTRPRLFETNVDDGFFNVADGNIMCEGIDPNAEVPAGQATLDDERVSHDPIQHRWYSDDSYNWYPEGVGVNERKSDGFEWDDETDSFRCPECGSKLIALP